MTSGGISSATLSSSLAGKTHVEVGTERVGDLGLEPLGHARACDAIENLAFEIALGHVRGNPTWVPGSHQVLLASKLGGNALQVIQVGSAVTGVDRSPGTPAVCDITCRTRTPSLPF